MVYTLSMFGLSKFQRVQHVQLRIIDRLNKRPCKAMKPLSEPPMTPPELGYIDDVLSLLPSLQQFTITWHGLSPKEASQFRDISGEWFPKLHHAGKLYLKSIED